MEIKGASEKKRILTGLGLGRPWRPPATGGALVTTYSHNALRQFRTHLHASVLCAALSGVSVSPVRRSTCLNIYSNIAPCHFFFHFVLHFSDRFLRNGLFRGFVPVLTCVSIPTVLRAHVLVHTISFNLSNIFRGFWKTKTNLTASHNSRGVMSVWFVKTAR